MSELLMVAGAAGAAALLGGTPQGPAAWVRRELAWFYNANFDRGRDAVDRLLRCPVCLGFWCGVVIGIAGGMGLASLLVGFGASWLNLAFAIRGVPAQDAPGGVPNRESHADAPRSPRGETAQKPREDAGCGGCRGEKEPPAG